MAIDEEPEAGMYHSKATRSVAIHHTPGKPCIPMSNSFRGAHCAASPVSTLVCFGFGRQTPWPRYGSVSPYIRMTLRAMVFPTVQNSRIWNLTRPKHGNTKAPQFHIRSTGFPHFSPYFNHTVRLILTPSTASLTVLSRSWQQLM